MGFDFVTLGVSGIPRAEMEQLEQEEAPGGRGS